MKTARANVGKETISNYFEYSKEAVEGVEKSNIMNYDETNFSDNPGTKKLISKHGVKYPYRIRNFSKGAVSVMFAGTASGTLLPPYVVYKSSKLWSTWWENGPKNARYARTDSGWFDAVTIEDWFSSIVLPWAKKQTGTKLLLGDNLSSHLNEIVIANWETHNIRFAFLPANTTHLT